MYVGRDCPEQGEEGVVCREGWRKDGWVDGWIEGGREGGRGGDMKRKREIRLQCLK